jgi:membrane dipeptidase
MTGVELAGEHLKRAAGLLRENFFCDGHVDTFNNDAFDADGYFDGTSELQADYPAMREAHLDLQITALYVPPDLPEGVATGRSLTYAGRILLACSRENGPELVLSRDDLERVAEGRARGMLIDLEGAEALAGDAGVLEVFHRAGVRCFGLTHNEVNEVGGGCFPSNGSDNGLTPFGRDMVRRSEKLGIAIDTAHLGRKSFRDLMNIAARPVINSHTCCAGICDLDRNLTDEMLRAIADSGGLTGITYVPYFLRPNFNPDNPVDSAEVFRHIEHAAEVTGIRHVGLGSDFDGTSHLPADVNGPREVVRIVARMVQAGWPDDDIKLVTGGNFRRVLGEILP